MFSTDTILVRSGEAFTVVKPTTARNIILESMAAIIFQEDVSIEIDKRKLDALTGQSMINYSDKSMQLVISSHLLTLMPIEAAGDVPDFETTTD